jgi:hypothetical protein
MGFFASMTDPSNAAPEWHMEPAVAQQRAGGCLSNRGVCSKCRFSIGNDRRHSPLLQDPYQSRADQRNRLPSMAAVDMEVAIGSEKQW